MALPNKALVFSEAQLQAIRATNKTKDGSHITYRTKVEFDGAEREGFFKELNPEQGYPELLAKISVATSEDLRTFLGDKSAEECLVFDKDNKIIGTFSFIVDGFTPFCYNAKKNQETDPGKREKTIPSTNKLAEENFTELAFAQLFLQNDDSHPGNNSLQGIIDFDMYWYWFTIYMKGARPVVGVPYDSPQITSNDYALFPFPIDSKPFHWFTFNNPGQISLPFMMAMIPSAILENALPKKYPDPEQFRKLLLDPKAQEDKLAIALKILLTYQPEVLEKRLTERFGDIPLNYTSLGPELSKIYETKFPDLCNSETNRQPFVKFMMKLHQKHYDALYRTVVFFQGYKGVFKDYNDKEYNVNLPSTRDALYFRPSLVKEITKWIKTDNAKRHKKDESLQLDVETKLTQRYHQIWRDAHLPEVKKLLQASYGLITKIVNTCSNEKSETEFKSADTSDSRIDKAGAFIDDIPPFDITLINKRINIGKNTNVVKAIEMLCEFHNGIRTAAQNYYNIKTTDLKLEHNKKPEDSNKPGFMDELSRFQDKVPPILENLYHETSYAAEFNLIGQNLTELRDHINFAMHISRTDAQMKQMSTAKSAEAILPLDHPEVLAQFNRSLYAWVKNLTPEKFAAVINKTIEHYEGGISLTRYRGPEVKEYLKESVHLPNDRRLAFILATAPAEFGALNKDLIRYLTDDMLKDGVYLPSVRSAVDNKTFKVEKNLTTYIQSTIAYAKANYDLRTIAELKQASFFSAMYNWIDELPDDVFTKMIGDTTVEYERRRKKAWKLPMFSSAPLRSDEVNRHLDSIQHESKAKLVALIFANGADVSTYNPVLFHKIMEMMQKDLSANRDKYKDTGHDIIRKYEKETYKAEYVPLLKQYTQEPLNRIKSGASESKSDTRTTAKSSSHEVSFS